MKILYFDPIGGISGDMILGALIDLGIDINIIKCELSKLSLHPKTSRTKGAGKVTPDEFTVSKRRIERHSIKGTKFSVAVKETEHHRTFKDIKALIEKSGLSSGVKELSIEIFHNLAKAEAKVHGVTVDKVHFHEVGAADSIVDIVGTAVGLEEIGAERCYCGPVPLGGGTVKTDHGIMPVPAPATVALLKGVKTKPSPVAAEVTTPTGAAIITTIVKKRDFVQPPSIPPMTIERVGYGAGTMDFKEVPNLLRIISSTTDRALSKPPSRRGASSTLSEVSRVEEMIVLESNIDDSTPEVLAYLLERLIDEGANDAFLAPATMKKSRLGTLLTVLTNAEREERMKEIIFTESSTIGIRSYGVRRDSLERRVLKVETPYGKVKVKASYYRGRRVTASPEFDDCRRAAKKSGLPIKKIMALVMKKADGVKP